MSLRILLLPPGTPAIRGTVRMVRENPDECSVLVYSADADPSPFSLSLFDNYFKVPPLHDPAYIPAVLHLCQREGIDLILFHHDEETALYMAHQEAFEAIGTRLVASPHQAVKTATHKAHLYEALGREGIPLPRYELVTAENCEEVAVALGYPDHDLIVKPPNCWGANGVYQLTARPLPWDQRLRLPMITLPQLKASLDRPVLMLEYLPGAEYSVDAFLGSQVAIALPRRRDRIVGGLAIQTTLEDQPELAELTLKAGRALGLRYVYGMQFKCDSEGRPRLLECNPRIQGSSVASWGSGLNLIWLAVREALGEPPADLPRPLHGATYARHWGGVVTAGDRSWEV
ncbi:MAG: ATP-grasp domain-containing protein [Parachlamydiales bacterium]